MTWDVKIVSDGTTGWEEVYHPNLGPQITFGRNGRTARRFFKVPNSDLEDFEQECLTGGLIPKPHPVYSNLLIDTVELAPFNEDFDETTSASLFVNTPNDWLATVSYSPWQSEPSATAPQPDTDNPVDILTGDMSFTVEVMTLPGYSLKWDSDDSEIKPETAQAHIKIPMVTWNLIIPRVNRIPWTAIRKCMGCVNKFQFWGADPETVLYNGATIQATFYSDGSKVWNVSHSFTERRIRWGVGSGSSATTTVYGWNHIWNPGMPAGPGGTPAAIAPKWDKPIDSTSGLPMYELSAAFPTLLLR